MAHVIAVSFERYGRLYYLDPGNGRFAVGDRVLVPTESGPEVAECMWAPGWVDDNASGFSDLPGAWASPVPPTWPVTCATGAAAPKPSWSPNN